MKALISITRLLAVLSVLVLAAGIATPTAAGKPERYTFSIDYTEEIPAGQLCSFPLSLHNYGEITYIMWADKEGNLVKEIDIFPNNSQVWTANGKTLYSKVNSPAHVTYLSATEVVLKVTGPFSFTVAPGMGPVFQSAGYFKAIFTILEDGSWVYKELLASHGITIYGSDQFCAYFEEM